MDPPAPKPTRAAHIAQTIQTDPEAAWIFVTDQLNTHQSETLVRLVATQCGIQEDLGVKGKSGHLTSMRDTGRLSLRPDSSHSPCLHAQTQFLAQSN